jgi:esterase/lipase
MSSYEKIKKEIHKDLKEKFDEYPTYEELKDQIDYVKSKILLLKGYGDDLIRMEIYERIYMALNDKMYCYDEYEEEIYGIRV